MKLKEAFRYQNALKQWIEEAESFLTNRNNIVKIEETHKKSLVNKEESDVVKEINNRVIDVEPNTMIDFIYDLVEEKNKVSQAISEAKRNSDVDLDVSIEINKSKQRLANIYNRLSNVKNSQKTRTDRTYKFNVEGNQTPYVYEVDEVTSIDYDRNKVRKLQKKLEKTCDETSTKIETLQLTIEVNHTPKYDVNDSFADLIEALKESQE